MENEIIENFPNAFRARTPASSVSFQGGRSSVSQNTLYPLILSALLREPPMYGRPAHADNSPWILAEVVGGTWLCPGTRYRRSFLARVTTEQPLSEAEKEWLNGILLDQSHVSVFCFWSCRLRARPLPSCRFDHTGNHHLYRYDDKLVVLEPFRRGNHASALSCIALLGEQRGRLHLKRSVLLPSRSVRSFDAIDAMAAALKTIQERTNRAHRRRQSSRGASKHGRLLSSRENPGPKREAQAIKMVSYRL